MRALASMCALMAILAISACGRTASAPQGMESVRLEQPDRLQQERQSPPGIIRVQSGGVVINGYTLSPQELAQLGNGIPPGDYWYDSVAGFWGYVGGPVQGQVMPGYTIGVLRQDASSGNTGTIINGREITVIEAAWLSRQVPVQRGRFWMNAQGVFGYEGGGPLGQIMLGDQGSGNGRHLSLSERGMLFRPGEILSGH